MADRVGTELAGYRIESLIARGGMGEVYLATQSFPERKVALKVLPPDLASDPAFRERFIRESNAAASLEHPNIVPVYAAGESDGELYIAMRYVDGEDLRTLIEREGALSPERAVSICAQIADALDDAHEHGLVHRDVKPGNILVSRGDRAYLTDFGLIRRSELETDLTKTGQFMGTVNYVAPEQIRGEQVDGRADVYSLACVLYECLTGEQPFRREFDVATLYAHLQDPVPRPSEQAAAVPAGVDEVISKGMAKRRDERYATAAEFARASQTKVNTRSPEVRPSEPLTGRSRRRYLIATIAVSLLVIIAPVLWLSSRHSPPSNAQRDSVAVSRIDPQSNTVASSIRDASRGWSAVAAEGALWIATQDGVVKRDESSGRIVKTLHTDEAAHSLAEGYGAIWLTTAAGAEAHVLRIDPATDEVRATIDISPSQLGGSGLGAIATGNGAVWVVDYQGTLWKIDPTSNKLIDRFPVAGVGTAVTTGAGSVWVADALNDTVVQIAPRTGAILDSVEMASKPDWLAFTKGQMWVEDYGAGTLTPIDLSDLTPGRSIAVAEHPASMVVGLGSLWVPADGAVSRVNPVTGEVRQIRIDFQASAVAVDVPAETIWAIRPGPGWGPGLSPG